MLGLFVDRDKVLAGMLVHSAAPIHQSLTAAPDKAEDKEAVKVRPPNSTPHYHHLLALPLPFAGGCVCCLTSANP